MRATIIAALGVTVAASTPALAQVRQNNPNAANESMERGSEMRALRQDLTTQGNTSRMQIERNQAGTFAPNTGPNALPLGGGTGVGAVR